MSILGVNAIICFVNRDDKIAEAKQMGAHYVFNSTKDNLSEVVHSVCPGGVEFVLDAVGKSDIINQAMGLITDQGKICCYGISLNTAMNLDWGSAPYNWNLQVQQFPAKYDESLAHNQIIDWMESGVINVKDFVSDIFDFSDIITAFQMVEQCKVTKKAIIRH